MCSGWRMPSSGSASTFRSSWAVDWPFVTTLTSSPGHIRSGFSPRALFPILLAVPIGVAVAASIGAIVSLVCRGLGSYHLAVATIAVAAVADRVLIDWSGVTGGSVGLGNIPPVVLWVRHGLRGVTLGALIVLWCSRLQ